MRIFLLFACLIAAILPPLGAEPVINEFCASNQNGLQDLDGDRPDWVEIFNPGNLPADLTNWYLTDSATNKTKWRFPAVTIPAGGYLVVFASGKDRAVAGQPLHTNFSLGSEGEYLGLVKPNGFTTVSQFNPSFPAQYGDLSYGYAANVAPVTFFAEGATGQWTIPSSSSNPGAAWNTLAFTPSGWTSTTMGVGYDRIPSPVSYLTQIGASGNADSAMTSQNNASCYLRVPFNVTPGSQVTGLRLKVKYDDGFIAWLNGQPLLSGGTQVRRNSLASPVWNSVATGQRVDSAAVVFEEFNVLESSGLLVDGQNVLAIQAFNHSPNTTDFLIRPELTGEIETAGASVTPGYFSTPTPGARNSGESGMVIPQEVTFSRNSGTFTTTFNLTLGGAVSGQQIRYTTDGSLPTAASTLYSGAISVTTSTVVRARIVAPATGALGFIGARHYEFLGTSVSSYAATGQPFKSSLPILVLNNRGGGEIGDAKENVRIQIYDRDASGYASLATTSVPTQTLNASINIRGRSSAGFPKKSYGFEVQNENGTETDVGILGMPAGSDWSLVGCYNFDRAFSRNAWIYEMSRQLGRWSPRTRLVEVYFNQNGSAGNPAAYGLSYTTDSDYRGVYILCESIRRGEDRVDVAAMDPSETTFPGVSGGFIFKVDQPESDEFTWKTSRGLPLAGTGGDNLVIHRPKLADLATQQSSYLVSNFQSFEDALFTESAGGFATRNYRNHIDSISWVDHHLFCTLAQNVDALRLSAYFHKDRAGKMMAGPLWDFDRSVNSTDSRDDVPTSWNGSGDATNFFTFAWWQQLFNDVEFRQAYVDRWHGLRKTTLATANVDSVFNGYLAEFKPADVDNPAERDYARWNGGAGANDISTEINMMKNWLSIRSTWIDGQFTAQPTIVRAPGPVAAGQTTTITVPSGTSVYYTLDGSDPRAEGGSPAASAVLYNGTPIALNATMKVRARAWRSGSYAVPATNWSGPVEALYLVNETYAVASSLRVSAIHYNPLAPDAAEHAALPEAEAGDFEWIELKNVGGGAINLEGVSLVEGSPVPALTLPAVTLAPGARALVVRDAAAFTLRYGSAAAARIVATWSGEANLDNGGETIHLRDRNGGVIAQFLYDDEGAWPERADGDGSALEYFGPSPLTADYQNPLYWNSSDAVHGQPGENLAASPGFVVVNEIRAHPLSPGVDAIELRNNGIDDADIGGWFLSQPDEPLTADDLRTFRIPDGTILPAGGYLLFEATAFSPNGEMPLDGYRGGTLWLASADPVSGKLHYFEQREEWSPLLPGVSYGRSPDGEGALVPLATDTPGAANAVPRVGPVQVTEIHYHPAGTTPEFVEISNTGATAEALDGWTLRGDVDFDFPAGFTLAPAEAVVMVAFDPVVFPAEASAFRSHYGVSANIRLVGPWSSPDTLGDATGTVRLRRKVPSPPEDPGFTGLMVEDEVNYQTQAPWPTTASGTGSSIFRVGVRGQGSDPASWASAIPAPGSGVGGYPAWQFTSIGDVPEGAPTADPDGDELPNLVEYLLGTDPSSPTSLVSGIDDNDDNGGNPRFVLDYSVRTDRDDAVLSARQSTGLEAWLPAEHDDVISTAGFTEQRRAWLPLGEKGFLRLEAVEAP